MSELMLDIETLGTTPGAAIVSIGAVAFDYAAGIEAEVSVSVDRQSCEFVGLHVDDETLSWWDKQDAEARRCLTGGRPLDEALDEFDAFYDVVAPDTVWACSPAFDCVLLDSAYRALDRDVPWRYWDQRDVRTLRDLPQWQPAEHEGVEHDALDDARQQARSVIETQRRLRGPEVPADD